MKPFNRPNLVEVIDACVDEHQCLDAERIADAVLEKIQGPLFDSDEKNLMRIAVDRERAALRHTAEQAGEDNNSDVLGWVEIRLRQYHRIKKKLET
jgi:hypothetical protein